MDIRKIKKLIELLEESGVSEIEICEGEESVRISRHSQGSATAALPPAPASFVVPSPASAAPVAEAAPRQTLKAPMVGTFYRSTSPGGQPLVEIGQRVEIGEPVCIIEAMKMFNQIESDCSGVVRDVLVDNGQPVEYDQPLLVIE